MYFVMTNAGVNVIHHDTCCCCVIILYKHAQRPSLLSSAQISANHTTPAVSCDSHSSSTTQLHKMRKQIIMRLTISKKVVRDNTLWERESGRDRERHGRDR